MIFEKTVSVKLERPFNWEGREVTAIDLDFSRVTGKVIMTVDREVFGAGSMAILPYLNPEYCSRVAAVISRLPFRVFEKMNKTDFNAVWQTVGAYIKNDDPQEFYDQYCGIETVSEYELDEDDDGLEEPVFTKPAATPEQAAETKLLSD